jgi:uncharacterized protein (TIGR03066 family)
MHLILRCAALALALVHFSSARADEKTVPKSSADKLVGVWELNDPDLAKLGGKATLEFTKDGKAKMSFEITGQKPMTLEGTYKVEGDTLKLTRSENGKDQTDAITIKNFGDDKILLSDKDGKDMELKRKGSAAKEPAKKDPPPKD